MIKGKPDHYCKPCRRHIQRRYERRYEERRRAEKGRWVRERRWAQYLVPDGYGGLRSFTDDDFDDAFLEQHGACAICTAEFDRMPDVDHDHETMLFRGLLCHRCNKGIGLFRDDVAVLEAAVRYLRGGVGDI